MKPNGNWGGRGRFIQGRWKGILCRLKNEVKLLYLERKLQLAMTLTQAEARPPMLKPGKFFNQDKFLILPILWS